MHTCVSFRVRDNIIYLSNRKLCIKIEKKPPTI